MFKGTPRFGPRAFPRSWRRRARARTRTRLAGRHRLFRHRRGREDRPRPGAGSGPDAQPLLDPREVDAERKVIVEERRTRTEDDPVGALGRGLHAAAFTAHPYRLPIIGFMTGHRAPDGRDCAPGTTPTTCRTTPSWSASAISRRPCCSTVCRARFGRSRAAPRWPPVRRGGAGAAGRASRVAAEGGAAPGHVHRLPDAELVIGRRLRARRPVGRAVGRAGVAAVPALVTGERLALDAGGDYSRLSPRPRPFTFYATSCPTRPSTEVERS